MKRPILAVLSAVALTASAVQVARAGKIHEAAAKGDTATIAKLLRGSPKLLDAPDEPRGCLPSRWTPLHAAAESGQLAVVKYLVHRGAKVDARDGFKDTPLLLAAEKGWSDIAKVLLDAGADPNASNWRQDTPLHVADNSKVAALLLSHGAHIASLNCWKQTPLFTAAFCGRTDVVRCLISRNARVTIHEAALIGDVPRIWAILKKNPGQVNARAYHRETPLHWALQFKHKEAAGALLAAGANVRAASEDGQTPLHYAVADGYKDVVTELLDNGALLNISITEGDGWATPLHAAVGTNNVEMAGLLLSRGAKVDIRQFGFADTPMHTAAAYSGAAMAELLLTHGADINARQFDDGSGDTPLHTAVKWNRVAMAKLLLDKGADVSAMTDNGETALHIAASRSLDSAGSTDPLDMPSRLPSDVGKNPPQDMVAMLISRGANVDAVDARGKNVLSHTETGRVAALLRAKGAVAGSIYEAALAGDADRVKALLSADARLDFAADGRKREPLHYAVIGGSTAIVRMLIARDVDVDCQDELGSTPLHLAVREGNAEIVRLLLEKHASVGVKDRDGLTPLQVAIKTGNREIADLLRSHGAKK